MVRFRRHLHPSDGGYEVMANAVEVGLFTTSRQLSAAGR